MIASYPLENPRINHTTLNFPIVAAMSCPSSPLPSPAPAAPPSLKRKPKSSLVAFDELPQELHFDSSKIQKLQKRIRCRDGFILDEIITFVEEECDVTLPSAKVVHIGKNLEWVRDKFHLPEDIIAQNLQQYCNENSDSEFSLVEILMAFNSKSVIEAFASYTEELLKKDQFHKVLYPALYSHSITHPENIKLIPEVVFGSRLGESLHQFITEYLLLASDQVRDPFIQFFFTCASVDIDASAFLNPETCPLDVFKTKFPENSATVYPSDQQILDFINSLIKKHHVTETHAPNHENFAAVPVCSHSTLHVSPEVIMISKYPSTVGAKIYFEH